MNREILYRAISMAKGEHWLYGQPRHYAHNPHTEKWTMYDPTTRIETDIVPETLGQYTGLTDKNGNAIWEGDIIRSFGTLGDRILHEVKWSDDSTGFVAFNEYGSDCGHIEKEWIKEYEKEVIGNIFENPEWRKGGE